MRIQVLLFAAFREVVGRTTLELEVGDRSTANDLYQVLQRDFPALEALRPYAMFAVNREVAEPRTELKDGDEIALLQPVSGGSSD